MERGATTSRDAINTSQVARGLHMNVNRIRPRLKELHQAAVLERSRRTGSGAFFLRRLVGSSPGHRSEEIVWPGRASEVFSQDVEYLQALSERNERARELVVPARVASFDIWDREDLNHYNQLVQTLHQHGFDSQLAAYRIGSQSYKWWLARDWAAKLERFLQERSSRKSKSGSD